VVSETTKLLRRIDLFRDLEEDDFLALAALVTEIEVGADEQIFDEQSAAAALYVILMGSVALSRGQGEVVDLGPGRHFGEIGISSGVQPFTAARVMTPGRILRLDKTDLLGLMKRRPTLALHLNMFAVRGRRIDVQPVASRRKNKRSPLDVPSKLLLPQDRSLEVVVVDLSPQGLSLRGAPSEWKVRQSVRFHLAVAGGYLELGGRIIWRQEETVGILFTDKSPGHDAKIRWALHQLEDLR
jgi:CRP-like cAMP-binding protein